MSELAETDDLLGSPKDSLVETGATEKLEDLSLGSDEEHEITMISVHAQDQVKDLPVSEASSARVSEQACSKLVRQDAVKPSLTTDVDSRKKEEIAKNGVRVSLVYLNKIDNKDLSSFGGRYKYIIKRHRKSVIRYEKIYGSTTAIL